MSTGSRANPILDYESGKALFDPSRNPVLQLGYVDDTHRLADPRRKLEAARKTKAFREVAYGWRPQSQMDLGILKDIRTTVGRRPPSLKARRGFSSAAEPMSLAADDAEAKRAFAAASRARSSRRMAWFKPLPFYPSGYLIHVPGADGATATSHRLVYRKTPAGLGEVARLSGSSNPIHALSRGSIDLSARGSGEEFLSYFCDHLAASGGCFTIVEERLQDGAPTPRYDGPLPAQIADVVAYQSESRGRLPSRPHLSVQIAHPIIEVARRRSWRKYIATIINDGSAARGLFTLDDKGVVSMLADAVVPGGKTTRLALSWHPDDDTVGRL